MIRQRTVRDLIAALLGGICAVTALVASAAEAQAPTQVATVFVVEGPPVQPYAPYFDRFTAVYKKHGMNVERELWQTGFAGSDSFRWVVVVKYATIEDFAKSGAVVSSPEYQAVNADMLQKGFKVLSASLQFRER